MFVVQCWQSALRDALVWKCGEKDKIWNQDKERFIENLSKLNLEFISDILYRTLELEKDFQYNFDKALLLERYWIEGKGALNVGS